MKVHSEQPPGKDEPGPIRRFLENRLIGNFDSEDFSDAWKKKFAHAPTWCDADMSLQQIKRGKAVGNTVALTARAFFQLWLFRIGCFVQRWAWSTIFISLFLYCLCLGGLRHVTIETDLVKLWVSEGGRLNEEMGYLGQVKFERESGHLVHKVKRAVEQTTEPPAPAVKAEVRRGPELPKENGLGGGFQVVIQTPSFDGQNILSKEALQQHTKLMEEISTYEVKMFNETWTLSDICFKPPGPSFNSGPLAGIMSKLLDKIIPCIWITPIDCYWDGAKPLGPNPPLNLGPEVASFVSSLPPGNVTWKNLNPTSVIKEVGTLFDLGPIGNFFERAGIDGAYLDRPCIDPLEEECPKSAPNYFDRCHALTKFNEWNMAKAMSEQVTLERKIIPKDDGKSDIAETILNDIFGKKRRKRQADTTTKKPATKKDEDYYEYEDDADYLAGIANSTIAKKNPEKEAKDLLCLEYGSSLLKWMQENPERLGEFLTKEEMPDYPNYGDVMTGGCKGFGKKIMEWPEDLIIGGIQRDNGKLVSAEALQSVFLVSGAYDVFARIKNDKTDSHPGLDRHHFQPWMAGEIISTWQRNFTKRLYSHELNRERRQFHPLASTSIADMLEEFSQFNYIIIVIGYILMVIYAAFTQGRFQGWWLAVQSNVALAICGVILVTISSICGLGFATHLGINFNAATTQVVPFLSLGLGIDDMFLLLHNYDEIINICNKNEIGVLLKETGMSVMLTSINNILAFISGYVLPIPALRSFCSQTAILLAFNLIFLMFIFPAMIGIDLRRQRKGKRDLAYCSRGNPQMATSQSVPSNVSNNTQMSSRAELAGYEKQADEYKRHEPWYTVGGFLNKIYIPALKNNVVKACVLIGTTTAVVFGLYGMYTSTLGLELADVLPEHTPPAAFLRAREQYFSFYPMFAVLRGDKLDIPNQQQLIEEYRAQLGSSKFMIKAEGKLQPYWMSMLRVWLQSLDMALEKDLAAGKFDLTNGNPIKVNGEKPSPESMIAARLVCSFGTNYNCDGRLGKMKMVENEVINPEGFYNYLTGWFNVDNMMYYVSQASFYPTPPGWEYNEKLAKVVPAAEPLLYSQMPFYQNDLIDTPAIVKMIEEIRATCEEYSERGLSNHPSGIAFTFWEQYLTLRWNLFQAICIIALAVFCVISILMFNPWAATLIMCIVVITTIELGGFMGLMGIKMNPISAVTLICAVGIGVEFTAHVELAFLTALGTIDQRLESCLQHMFVPVYHGAISTFLGVVMLVFSEFDFVVTYFFYTMTLLVALGVFNGLCVLPVILTLVGPKPELTPTDGSSVLPPPPPLRQQYAEKSGGVEGGMRKRKEKRPAEVEMSARDSPSTSSASHSSDDESSPAHK
ncbi:Protein patched homolog 3 [Caenorhabditis elegans]|uniref:Isoform b of Protein patched homolog 3 n=1 Tax=Caenorhabditis elegans TaxID=6239 RepID=H2L0G5-3|nr:Protein patched homolog 3 [Caenorhabditis elegans]CCD72979.1 Protein patched homolog 3 [Caenorhabditis elegans]|eukprot:NP_494383.2 Protein patched homolog 3 [Caenorhabditis elegans]